MRNIKVIRSEQEFNSKRLHVFIHERHHGLIKELIRRRKGITKKDIVYSALENFFTPEQQDKTSAILSELSKIKNEQYRLKFNTDTLLDTFAVFVKIWMCHTHEIPKEHEEAAVASMNRRFRKFIDIVLSEMKTGGNPLLNFSSSDDLANTLTEDL